MAATKSSERIQGDTLLRANIFKSCSSTAAKLAGWHVEAPSAASSLWIMVRNDHAANRAQGWKLHISASIVSAEAVLDQALGVLLVERAEFKVVASLTRLAELNNGAGGLSQIGKFITVYPNDDQQAVRLALALHEATRGLRGPAIPSDRQLVPGSLVYYRYGSFINRQMQTLAGVILPAISTPDGDLVPDLRTMLYQARTWVTDPFEGVVATSTIQPRNPLLNNRYLIMATLYRSPGGAVAQALDITALRRCIIKRAAHDTYVRIDRQDARDILRHEAAVLARLAPDERFPIVFELFEQNEDLFLVMEDLAGETLEHYVGSLAAHGRWVPIPQAIAWGRALADALATIHAKGFVHCDLKLSNVIVTPEKRLRLIDFDLAYELVGQSLPYGHSTRGYASPQQAAGERPVVSDDVYSLGALLYSMVTGVDPTLTPRPLALLDRPLSLLNPSVGPALAELISRCLDANPANRFPSMLALNDALAVASIDSEVTALLLEDATDLASRVDATRRYRALALRLGDSLCASLHRTFDEMEWLIDGDVRAPVDLYDGSAGTLLALAELAITFDNPSYRAALAAAAVALTQKSAQ